MNEQFRLETSSGPVIIEIDTDGAVTRCDFSKHGGGHTDAVASSHAQRAIDQLREYFSGDRKTFDLRLRLKGTEFQRKVWAALQEIPFGQTISYSELARRIGSPKAVRAVGRANGANPVSIIVPCHRVIGSDGSLTGYGGGMDRKRELLRLEGILVAENGEFRFGEVLAASN